MITRSIAIVVMGVGVLSSGPAFAQFEIPAPSAPPQTLTVGPGAPVAGVKTNRTRLFSQAGQPNPVLPPGFIPPGTPPVPPRAPNIYPSGVPAPLANSTVPMLNPQAVPGVIPAPPTQPASYIVWDSESKEYSAKVGDTTAHFTFYLTNVSKEVVMVNSVRTSCGCTVAQLPEQPWHLAPGTNGPINVSVNLAGKSGTIVKSVTVDSSAGVKSLLVKVNIPTAPAQAPVAGGLDVDRMRNMQMALGDNKAIFKNDCAKCHFEPAVAKSGAQLYTAVCGICHDSAQRAALVPDLKKLNHPTNPEHWRKWIASGKPGSMMPSFAKAEGGPLDDAQIASLVRYLSDTIPSISQSAAANVSTPVAGAPALANPGAPKIQ
jgi:hypothetical protein